MQTYSNHVWSDQKNWIRNVFKYHEDKKTTEYNMNNSSNKIELARDNFFHSHKRTKGLIYIHEVKPQ